MVSITEPNASWYRCFGAAFGSAFGTAISTALGAALAEMRLSTFSTLLPQRNRPGSFAAFSVMVDIFSLFFLDVT